MQHPRPSLLEFGVRSLGDIRLLMKTWNEVLSSEGEEDAPRCIFTYVTVDDREPGEEVALNFQDQKELLERFLKALEEQGVKFVREELVPEMVTVCRMNPDTW